MNSPNDKIAKEFIEDGQFMLKLPFLPYAVLTVPSIALIVFLYFTKSSFVTSVSLYTIGMLLYYKFMFAQTRKGQHYQSFMMQKIVLLLTKVRHKASRL